jgi:hypothetical protein
MISLVSSISNRVIQLTQFISMNDVFNAILDSNVTPPKVIK